MTRTSFVVIAYNEEENIAATVGGIVAQDGLDDFEVIVVDDGSVDGTAGVVRALQVHLPQLRLIDLGRNRGRGAARAAGIAAAEGDEVALIDGDIVIGPDWLTRCRRGLSDHDAVGGIAVPDGDVSYLHRICRLQPKVVAHPMAVTGSNALYRAGVFHVVGFDPDRRNGEDIDLVYQLQEAGLRTSTIPGLIVEHREIKSLPRTLAWLFESGIGASRQFYERREVRTPDLAYGAFAATAVGATCAAACRRTPLWTAIAAPAGLVLLASAAHVQRKFHLSRPLPVAGAVALDTLQLSAYYLGRTVGAITHLPLVRRP